MSNKLITLIVRFAGANQGSISIGFIFFTIIAFSTFGVVSYSVMKMDGRMSVKHVLSIKAQYLAESAAEYGIAKVFDGQMPPYSETTTLSEGRFEIYVTQQEDYIRLLALGRIDNTERQIEVLMQNRPPLAGFAIYSTGDVDNVTTLDEGGDPDPDLMLDNVPQMPVIDDSSLIALATSQSQVVVGDFEPSHGYPFFNFYYAGTTPAVTYVQGDLKVKGGRTVYGIYMVEGDIVLEGSSRVHGVLYLTNPLSVVLYGGGNPTESSVTGGIIANGDVDGTGNHITAHYNAEYMNIFGSFEDPTNAREIFLWREL